MSDLDETFTFVSSHSKLISKAFYISSYLHYGVENDQIGSEQ